MRASGHPADRRLLWLLVAAVPVLLVVLWQVHGNATAQGGPGNPGPSAQGPAVYTPTAEEKRRGQGYWTKERRDNAKPVGVTRVVPQSQLDEPGPSAAPSGPPGFTRGSQGNAPASDDSGITSDANPGEPQHGTKPSNPKDGPYGPFQRYSLRGKYTNYPARTIGRLFSSAGSCSASVIGQNKIVTAGHCISNGAGSFFTNFEFCPAWRPSGPNPAYGCWDNLTGGATSNPWHFSGDLDYDYAVLTFGNDGVCNCLVGNAVGWMGYGWNWGTSQPDMAFGYPGSPNPPWNSHVLIQVSSTDWYTHDWNAGGQVAKIMGNDMGRGSSGGPWVLGWIHPSAERADTDGSNNTDPAGPFVNGVNSAKRCSNFCSDSPTTTSGTFTQEMASPPFENTSDNNDVTDVIAAVP